ncbi:MAG: hypothetical protein ACJATI_005199 [Halioglobus sp.]|jgi:hypothetical protein
MKYIIIIFTISLFSSSIIGQDNFFRSIRFDLEVNRPKTIFYEKGRYFSFVAHFCGAYECCSLVEFSEKGDTLNRVIIQDIDPASRTMIISNDTITIIGNNDELNDHPRMAHFDLEGNKLGETIEIYPPNEEYFNAFQLSAQKINGKFHILGTATNEESDNSLMYVAYPNGELDTLITIASAREATPSDSYIDSEGNIVTFNKIKPPNDTDGWIEIVKYNSEYDKIWTYETEKSINHLNGVKGVDSEQNIIFNTYTQPVTSPRHTLRSVDQNKNETKIYEPEHIASNVRGFSRLKTLANGDILGLGGFQDLSFNPPIHQCPWMIRMSPAGDIKWQRVFYELDPLDSESRFGTLRDVVELPNGDLYGVGDMKFDNITHSIVFKVGADGCLTPDDCGIVQFVTDTENVDISDDITVYPNPVSDRFSVSIPEGLHDCSFMIIDEMGRMVRTMQSFESPDEVSVAELSSGLYYLVVVRDGKMIGTRKVVIANRN